jgi:hypothetical protein
VRERRKGRKMSRLSGRRRVSMVGKDEHAEVGEGNYITPQGTI